jgi:hypothetical protein
MIKTYSYKMIDPNPYGTGAVSTSEVSLIMEDVSGLVVGIPSSAERKEVVPYKSEEYTKKYRSFWFWFIPVFWLIPRTRQEWRTTQSAVFEATLWHCDIIMKSGNDIPVIINKQTIDSIKKNIGN